MDGKLVAMDEEGRSNFTLLQNFKSAESKIHNFPFDVLVRLLISRSSASRRLQSTRCRHWRQSALGPVNAAVQTCILRSVMT